MLFERGPSGAWLGGWGWGGGGRAPQVHAMLHAPNNLPERRRWMAEMMSKIVQLGDRKIFGKKFFITLRYLSIYPDLVVWESELCLYVLNTISIYAAI